MKKIEKPWGHEILFAETPHYAGKIMAVRKGERLSLQYHKRKDETLYLYSGRLMLYLGADEQGGSEMEMSAGDAQRVAPGEVHRITALEDCVLFEVSTPHLDDVVRLQDDHGRAERKKS
jgi:mannose-6-phosphate isomerase-like protein (cupin superfamily)